MGMFMAVTMESTVFMGKITWTSVNSFWTRRISHWNKCSTYLQRLVSEQERWDLRIGNDLLVQSFKETSVTNWWWKNHQFSTHEGLRLFGFCVVLWEDSRELPIERCMGKNWDGSNLQKITETLTELTASPWNSSRIFPKIQYVAAKWKSQKFTVEIRRDTREIHKKDFLHVDVRRRLLWIKKQWKNANQILNSFLYMRKDLDQDNGHFSVLV